MCKTAFGGDVGSDVGAGGSGVDAIVSDSRTCFRPTVARAGVHVSCVLFAYVYIYMRVYLKCNWILTGTLCQQQDWARVTRQKGEGK